MTDFSIDFAALEEVAQRLQGAGESVEDAITEVLHTQAGRTIADAINPLIHPSGCTFKGHTASATVSDWSRFDTNEPLAVTVATKGRFHYLYFPDDGTNTKHHVGSQHFMERGAESASKDITNLCIKAILARLEQ